MALEEAEARLHRGKNLRKGTRSIHMGSHNREKYIASKICEIVVRKYHGSMRELTEGEETDMWAGWPSGGAGRPHLVPSHGILSLDGFLPLSNPKKYIFAL